MANNTEQERLARLFHDTYERLAPQFGYETRDDTKQFDPTSPNGKLMIAVCSEVMKQRDTAIRLNELDRYPAVITKDLNDLQQVTSIQAAYYKKRIAELSATQAKEEG